MSGEVSYFSRFFVKFVKIIAAKPPGLGRGLTIETATDILAALHSPDVYQGLSARGWSHARCTRFFQQLLASQLLDP